MLAHSLQCTLCCPLASPVYVSSASQQSFVPIITAATRVRSPPGRRPCRSRSSRSAAVSPAQLRGKQQQPGAHQTGTEEAGALRPAVRSTPPRLALPCPALADIPSTHTWLAARRLLCASESLASPIQSSPSFFRASGGPHEGPRGASLKFATAEKAACSPAREKTSARYLAATSSWNAALLSSHNPSSKPMVVPSKLSVMESPKMQRSRAWREEGAQEGRSGDRGRGRQLPVGLAYNFYEKT